MRLSKSRWGQWGYWLSCHGIDGEGTNLGPEIRGKTADDIKQALAGDAMSFIRLTDDDIEAVAAYLKYLESPP